MGCSYAPSQDSPITAGSLVLGARKALTLIGLLYLSQYMVTAKPSFPGRLGKVLSLQFFYFERITTRWKGMEKRDFIGALDKLLFSLEQEEIESRGSIESEVQRATGRDVTISVVHICIFWVLLALGTTDILPSFT